MRPPTGRKKRKNSEDNRRLVALLRAEAAQRHGPARRSARRITQWQHVPAACAPPSSSGRLKVKAALEERIELAGLKDQFGEILVPTESVVELKSGAKKKTERKFFPGYILIEMEMNDDTWQLVKHTPRVSTFVGGKKDKPSPISKSDVDNILNRIEVGEEAPRPKTLFEPGEVIRVCDGPFNDFNGIVEEVDYERSSVKVSVQILGRSTPVQLDFIQIEKT